MQSHTLKKNNFLRVVVVVVVVTHVSLFDKAFKSVYGKDIENAVRDQ